MVFPVKEETAGRRSDSLEQTEDEGVHPHAVAAELGELAHLGEQAVEDTSGRA